MFGQGIRSARSRSEEDRERPPTFRGNSWARAPVSGGIVSGHSISGANRERPLPFREDSWAGTPAARGNTEHVERPLPFWGGIVPPTCRGES